jgi:death-on-curing protein
LVEALIAHEFVLRQYGGRSGIRDLGTIESALARPYSGYYRQIEWKAAALVHSLVLNHGFTDGNKRTSVFMLGILLWSSGYSLAFKTKEVLNDEIVAMVLAVAEHHMNLDQIAAWIKERLVKLPKPNKMPKNRRNDRKRRPSRT